MVGVARVSIWILVNRPPVGRAWGLDIEGFAGVE
jgi:hypothetical protein